jgi:Skp family chaperone for outer membrane proteins
MMRMRIAPVLGVLLVAGTAAAQTPQTTPAPAPPAAPPSQPAAPVPFPADAKVGFVSMQAIVSNSALGKAGQEKMKALSDAKSTELSAKNKQIQTLQQEVQSGQNVLAPAVLAQKNTELEKLTREVQFLQEQAQVDIQNLNDQLLEEFTAKVLPIVEQVRAERNLWVVFSLGDGTGVVAVNRGLDLSSEVIKRLDAAK